MHIPLWYLKKKKKGNFSCKGEDVYCDVQVLDVLVERVSSPDTLLGHAVNGCDAAPSPRHTSHSALVRTQDAKRRE